MSFHDAIRDVSEALRVDAERKLEVVKAGNVMARRLQRALENDRYSADGVRRNVADELNAWHDAVDALAGFPGIEDES